MWLFVDFDGTLVDSLKVALVVYQRFVAEFGGQPDETEFRALNGPSLPEIVNTIADRCGIEVDRAQLLDRYAAIWAQAYQSVLPKEGSTEFLREAHLRGFKTAIVTSARREFVAKYIEKGGWSGLVDQTISGDEVPRSKPDPAIYLLALAQTGADTTTVQALEDSVNGIRAAVAAGIPAVGLADRSDHSCSPEQLQSAGAVRVIGALNEFFAGQPA
jgi:beta-phosphoglucomutase